MRTDALHRRVIRDCGDVMDAVGKVLPAKMPQRHEGHAINLAPFIQRLNTATEPLGIFNERKDDLEIPFGALVVSGLWLPQDELPENGSTADVRLLWHAHPTTQRIPMTQLKWNRRRFYFWLRVSHELVHRHQDARRDEDAGTRTYRVTADERDTKELQSYYANYDELEAYAHDTALEMVTWYPCATFHASIVGAGQTQGAVESTWNVFLSAFEPSHPAVDAFKRKVRSWWDVMRQTPEFYSRLQLPRLV